MEFDASCVFCGGSGSAKAGVTCGKCKGSGWIELFGAGMVDPAVYGFVDYRHSGDVYPARFMRSTRLDAASLRRSEDAHVHFLFGCAKAIGAPMLSARFPRAYLDLNREPYELDPRMFEDTLPDFANTRSLRVAAGLGTIPRVVADAHEIYTASWSRYKAYAAHRGTLQALSRRSRSADRRRALIQP